MPNVSRQTLLSGLSLLGSALFAIFLARTLSWNLFEVVVLYWVQALIIGVFQYRKVRDMINYTQSQRGTPRSGYLFGRHRFLRHDSHQGFAVIYGLFWLLEGVLLAAKYVSGEGLSLGSLTLLLGAMVFFASHLVSYRSNRAQDQQRTASIENILFAPLFRMVLPLHIFTLTVGFERDYGTAGILIWMLMKTVVDLGMHAHEHRRQAARQSR